MSKRWKVSQQINDQKEAVDAALLLEEEPMGRFMAHQPSPDPAPVIKQRKAMSVSKIFFVLIFLSLLGLNAQLFMLAQRYVVKIDDIGVKIGEIQKNLSSQDNALAGVSRNLLTATSKQAAFESEIVAMKDKVLNLEGRQTSSAEINELKKSLSSIESQLAVLLKNDAEQSQTTRDLQDKSDRLLRKFTLYDMELRSIRDMETYGVGD